MITLKDLNGFYEPLNAKRDQLVRPFCKIHAIFDYETIASMDNFTKLKNGKFQITSFPLPSILIHSFCKVTVTNDDVLIVTRLDVEDALNFDLSKLQNYQFEVFNPYDRNEILYTHGLTKETYRRKLINYDDNAVAFEFSFDFDLDPDDLYGFVKLLRRNRFYWNR